MIEAWHWFVFGLVLTTAELFVPSFALLWFGVAGILVGAIAYVFVMSFLVQVVIWLGLSVLFCIGWFKFINPKFKMQTKSGLGAGTIIGDDGMIVIVPSPQQAGVVRFSVPKAGASEWACRSRDNLPLQIGERVIVLDIIGNELLVDKK